MLFRRAYSVLYTSNTISLRPAPSQLYNRFSALKSIHNFYTDYTYFQIENISTFTRPQNHTELSCRYVYLICIATIPIYESFNIYE